MVKLSARKIAGALRGGGHGEDIRSVELLLLRRLVVGKEEKLVVQDRPADGAAFLVAMEGGRRVRRAAANLALLVEVFVGGQNVGPENAEGVAMELIARRTW